MCVVHSYPVLDVWSFVIDANRRHVDSVLVLVTNRNGNSNSVINVYENGVFILLILKNNSIKYL